MSTCGERSSFSEKPQGSSRPSRVMSTPQATGSRVLLVEDDADLGRALVGVLAAEGHEVRWAQGTSAARALLASAKPDLILLDLGLPDGDGLDLCREIRRAGDDVVVVVITARTDEADAVQALDGGADDFVLKPFRPIELLARLRAHLRRRPISATSVLRCGDVRLDQGSRRAWVGDVEVALRPKEHELLAVLVASAGTAIRREELMDQVWDEHWSGSTKTLDVHVANVRRKLADAGERWDRISTLRGFGYRFELE